MATQTSIQERIRDTMLKAGIPADSVEVYGSQIVVTSRSRAAARRWATLISEFATLRGVIESIDYNKVNTDTNLLPSTHKVWRTYGRI